MWSEYSNQSLFLLLLLLFVVVFFLKEPAINASMRLSEIVQNDTQLEPTTINQVSAVMQILVNESVMDVDVSIFFFHL